MFEQSLCGISLPGWVSRMSSFPELRPDELLHGTGQANESWATLWAAKIRRIPSGEPDVSVLAGRGHRRRVVTLPSKARFSFQEARVPGGTATG
ncbi:phage portal, lambda family domain protein [Escherichia coli 180200]|nr:phage portal, lambda family domain protein [Escherichia coli 180200]